MNSIKPERIPTKENLNEILHYDPDSGSLTWKYRPNGSNRWNTRYAGKPALYVLSRGYQHGTIRGKRFLAHRVIWKLVHGTEAETIDHINGVRSDNRLRNLRAVTKAENLMNKEMSHKNKSGYNGVCFHKQSGKWLAYTQKNKKRIYLGLHLTPEEAHSARRISDPVLGYHENHGRKMSGSR